ncbi:MULTISPECIES: exodeoxyribonuclease VII large subunit [unclassified Roseitalea]|uniref:exodeoxyribonuclease VII large subunit n=1 Tax=unclassified Roseitalea TaxID=2639107 RepID=UPI00273E36BF|nr:MULTISPECIES: exodeoxyribonuclease VII large subunit [unclassified Roseitalea]
MPVTAKPAGPAPASNVAEYSVFEISQAVKRTVEDTFGRVRVRGEVSGYRGPHASGHCYFRLKDERATLEAVIWRGAFSKLAFKPEEGLEVIATGRMTTYPGSSKYQIVIDTIEPAGAGALMALLEERRRKLAAEGLFDGERKRPLPYLPRVIGVVTSPTGAVIRDIVHRIADRFPTHVLVWPVRVQGETSAAEVAAAIDGFNALAPGGPVPRPDVLIVARGGGSLEDLWGFNEEIVVRAAARSQIPLISAVGHETDTTLIDHAGDRRAPTPTGAAEIAVPVRAELQAHVAQLGARLAGSATRAADDRRARLRALARGLPQPDQLLAMPRQRLDGQEMRLRAGLGAAVAGKRARLDALGAHLSPARLRVLLDQHRATLARLSRDLPQALSRGNAQRRRDLEFRAARLTTRTPQRLGAEGARRLTLATARLDRAAVQTPGAARGRLEEIARLMKSLSYEGVLERGFALVRDASGAPVRGSAGVRTGDRLSIQFAGDDRLEVRADGRSGGPPSTGNPARARGQDAKNAQKRKNGPQGSLF